MCQGPVAARRRGPGKSPGARSPGPGEGRRSRNPRRVVADRLAPPGADVRCGQLVGAAWRTHGRPTRMSEIATATSMAYSVSWSAIDDRLITSPQTRSTPVLFRPGATVGSRPPGGSEDRTDVL